jgi:hypothetical protein
MPSGFPLLRPLMRAVRVLAFCLLAFCILGCATDSIGGDLQMRVIGTGSYAASTPDAPEAILVTSASEYPKVWKKAIGDAAAPAIDFETECVVILLGGSRSTGGWSVEPRAVQLEDGVLVVDAAVKGPPADAIVTQAFTSPYAVIAVNTKAPEGVRWKP